MGKNFDLIRDSLLTTAIVEGLVQSSGVLKGLSPDAIRRWVGKAFRGERLGDKFSLSLPEPILLRGALKRGFLKNRFIDENHKEWTVDLDKAKIEMGIDQENCLMMGFAPNGHFDAFSVHSPELHAITNYWGHPLLRMEAIRNFLDFPIELQKAIHGFFQNRNIYCEAFAYLAFERMQQEGRTFELEQKVAVKLQQLRIDPRTMGFLMEYLDWEEDLFSGQWYASDLYQLLILTESHSRGNLVEIIKMIPFSRAGNVLETIHYLLPEQQLLAALAELLNGPSSAYEATIEDEYLFAALRVIELPENIVQLICQRLFRDGVAACHACHLAMKKLLRGPNAACVEDYLSKEFQSSFQKGKGEVHFESALAAVAISKSENPMMEALDQALSSPSEVDLLLAISQVELIIWQNMVNESTNPRYDVRLTSGLFIKLVRSLFLSGDARFFPTVASLVALLILRGWLSRDFISDDAVFAVAVDKIKQRARGYLSAEMLICLSRLSDHRKKLLQPLFDCYEKRFSESLETGRDFIVNYFMLLKCGGIEKGLSFFDKVNTLAENLDHGDPQYRLFLELQYQLDSHKRRNENE